MSELAKVPPPIPLAIGVCDFIHRDRGTGKRFILGCFQVVHAASFPAKHPVLGIYVDLTNGRGNITLRVQIVDVDEERDPVWEAEVEFEFTDPRMVGEFDFIAGGLEFPAPGEYRVKVYLDSATFPHDSRVKGSCGLSLCRVARLRLQEGGRRDDPPCC